MTIVLHQLKKDIVRTRVLVALWFLLVLGQFALVGWNTKPGDVLLQTIFPILATLLTFFN
jgi:hypothetical protein